MSQTPPRRDAGHGMSAAFTRISTHVAHWSGRPIAFVLCCVVLVIWAATGPVFHFSDTWQLIINTGTTIVTFLMVFLIQNTQNRDGAALQAKLDELIRVTEAARNQLIGIEQLPEDVVEEIREKGSAIAEQQQPASQAQQSQAPPRNNRSA